MQKIFIRLAVGVILFGMLLSACATNSSTARSEETEEMEASASSTPAVATEPAADDQAAQRRYEIERNRFAYEDIFFAKNRYQLDDRARTTLDWKANWLQDHPQVKVIIEGHCGEGGSAENNMALGLRRAGEVKGYLIQHGIARDRLTAISYGIERPIAQGAGEEAQAKNRRVRTVIVEE